MLSGSVVEVPSFAALSAVTGDHPAVRYLHGHDRFGRAWAWVQGSRAVAAAWVLDDRWRGRTLTAIGAPAEAAATVATAHGLESGLVRITVPVGSLDHLRIDLADGADWDWFWAEAAPDRRPGEDEVVAVDVDDPDIAAEVTELLAAGAPEASSRPGDGRPGRWWGVRVPTRAGSVLAACAAVREDIAGVPSLRSITTHPDFRGRGLASALVAAIMRRHLAVGAKAVTLGMYADNDTARRIYEKLGFTVGQAFASRRLPT